MRTVVRCQDRMTFEVNPKTLEAKQCSSWDLYCYSDPLPDVRYIEFSDWILELNEKREKNDERFHGAENPQG